jgi:hypothetical protein
MVSSRLYPRVLGSTLLGLAMAWLSSAASAAAAEVGETSDAEHASAVQLSFSILAGFGAGGRFEDNDVNRYGVGFGGRVGVTLEAPRLYLGASFIRFLGGEDASGEFYTSTLDAEVGYDFSLLSGLFVVRPELALGVAQAVTIQSDNAGYPLTLHWAPGLLIGVEAFPQLLVTAEIRLDMVPDQWSNAGSFLLGAGVRF